MSWLIILNNGCFESGAGALGSRKGFATKEDKPVGYIEMVHSYKRYHMGTTEIAANRDVNFSIEKGELAIILGSSGAGKSTVLNILGGMEKIFPAILQNS